MAEDDATLPQIINPPNTLQGKISKGGAGAVDLAALERAEQVIANLAGDYLLWAEDDLVRLEKVFGDLKANPGGSKDKIHEIFQISHDMKGQGGSFNYPLMTAVGDRLCRLVEKWEKAGKKEIEMIGLHVNAMKLIISQRMEGDGGPEGQKLLNGLTLMVNKFSGG
ncbi:phosphorelay protein [Varunaivibrio sulfuroxidans]|uniref:Hpt domain-containing protein n=1 Tax=Varunaivibrio sulfuroxidans TaxID=1773489 RepID=A0A4R3J819_9PROT|nr:phosphorelay protein [Varunaivibrio sulfuroxidans]TCS62099.1 hypothetical protein EDD55_10654 [Varunaivibrio sulfuroxidans]WES30532.1 phosphorelay protein [Varunaivibrio sulfuroxidans]